MADKFETNTKFRHFAWGALIIFGIVVPILAPIAWQLKGIIALFVR